MASPNSNLCDMSYPYGTYALSLGVFQIIQQHRGLPLVRRGQHRAAFDTSCSQLSLIPQTDNCTGGRVYFEMPTTLTRRVPADAGTTTSP